MKHSSLIENTINFVKDALATAEGGHDWFHIERVFKNAKRILQEEQADETIVLLGALLHDIADSKFYEGDESVGPRKARNFLEAEHVSEETIQHIKISFAMFPLREEIKKVHFNRRNWKSFRMPTDWMRLVLLGLHVRLITVALKIENCTILPFHPN